jgi:hypothetical protein
MRKCHLFDGIIQDQLKIIFRPLSRVDINAPTPRSVGIMGSAQNRSYVPHGSTSEHNRIAEP